ncbi:MAG: AIPR family protein [Selenomonas sp.]|uniref:AIPR family protein n=1 Tax=Selenomonas sp. TaxID=2053611 RepID=UPI0025E8F578|nr:AIPR family protein [Selenomonas sp.]MCR5438516.1 AIPR family protein [Selenomonas sp.]
MAKKQTNNQILLKEIIRQEFSENEMYDSENAFFEFFSTAQVLKDKELSDEEINSGITGGGNDGGCDGIYLFVNNELISEDQLDSLTAPKGAEINFVIVQAKMTTSFGEDVLMKWKTVSRNLLDMTKDFSIYRDKKRYTEQVIDLFCLFRNAVTKLVTKQPKIFINYYYTTLGIDVNPNVKAQADELREIVNELYCSAQVDVDFITADKLMELYNTDVENVLPLKFAGNPISRGKNSEYVALVNLREYYTFITDENGRLRAKFFESNVRDYQGKNSVNTSIAESLKASTGEDFWWLNNGITILADNIVPIRIDEYNITNPAVVNGLQTSTEIYNFFSENQQLIKQETRNVLVRIIVPSSEEARDKIIFATNNQTNIPKSSLRVTDIIHLQIEMYFKRRGLYYDRRKNYYKNKKKKASEIISVSFLAQCMISIFLRKPDFARARPSTLLTDDDTYKKLYESNVDLSVYYNTALIGARIRDNLAKTSEMTSGERTDILYYLIYAVSVRLFNKKYVTFDDMKNANVLSVTNDDIDYLKKIIYSKYINLGGNSSVAKSSEFIKKIDECLDKNDIEKNSLVE